MDRDNVKLWYFVGSVNSTVIHVDHDVFGIDDGKQKAIDLANDWYNRGVFIDGELVMFDNVIAISEDHETVFHVTRQKVDSESGDDE